MTYFIIGLAIGAVAGGVAVKTFSAEAVSESLKNLWS